MNEHKRNPSLEQAFTEAKFVSLQGTIKALEKKAKYWEQKYYSRLQETLESRNVERIRELVQQQYLGEIEHLKDNVKDLEEEKGNLVRVIKKVQDEYRKAKQIDFTAYAKPRQYENANIVEHNMQLELYQKLLADKIQECESLRANTEDTGRLNAIIADLNNKLTILKDENRTYLQQIQILIVRLSLLLGKPVEVLAPQVEELTQILKAEIPQPRETLEETGKLMMEAAGDKIRVLQLELRLQEEKYSKLRRDDAGVVFLLKEKVRKLEGMIKALQREKEKEELEGYRDKLKKEGNRYYRRGAGFEKIHNSGNSDLEEVTPKGTAQDYETKREELKSKGSSKVVISTDRSKSPKGENNSRESASHQSEAANSQYGENITSFSEILRAWENLVNNSARVKLLNKILKTPKLLKESTDHYLAEYTKVLSQAFDSGSTSLCDAGVLCVSEILERRKLDIAEFSGLGCNESAIGCLRPQKPSETDGELLQRHTAALNVVAYMKNLGIEWNSSMVKHLASTNALTTVESYLKNFDVMEGVAVKASYAIAYIASCAESIRALKQTNIHDIIMNIISVSTSRELVENAVECLMFLTKDKEMVKLFEEDERVGKLVSELAREPVDNAHRDNLLECLLPLVRSKSLKILLCDDELGRVLGETLADHRKLGESTIIKALKLAEEICYPQCSENFLKHLIPPIAELLTSPKEAATAAALAATQKVVKCDDGRLLSEYPKLIKPVLDCTKSASKKVSNEAFRTYSLFTGYAVEESLKESEEEVMRRCIDSYCGNEDIEAIQATQSLLKSYINSSKEYKEDMQKLWNPELLKNVIVNLTVDDMAIQKQALEILTGLLKFPECIQMAAALEETKAILKKFTVLISVPISLGESEL